MRGFILTLAWASLPVLVLLSLALCLLEDTTTCQEEGVIEGKTYRPGELDTTSYLMLNVPAIIPPEFTFRVKTKESSHQVRVTAEKYKMYSVGDPYTFEYQCK